MSKIYDYTIIGGGCAGLSLLYRMISDPFFKHQNILLIEPDSKTKNDRTWSFWSKEKDFYHDWAIKAWDQIEFADPTGKLTFNINPYRYYTIRGIDFYQKVIEAIESSPQVDWLRDEAKAIVQKKDHSLINTKSKGPFKSKKIFDSRIPKNIDFSKSNFVWQHFKGWVIQSDQDYFDDQKAVFMDFSIDQKNDTRFFYVLPYSKREALVELAIFSNEILSSNNYDILIKNYLEQRHPALKYTVSEAEYDKIPMTDYLFPISRYPNHMYIGAAGGMIKSSSGYTFTRIQQHSNGIINALKNQRSLVEVSKKINSKKYRLLDSTLLNVILEKRLTGQNIFSDLFRKNKAQDILSFLDQEAGIIKEIRIMKSLPTLPFFKSFIQMIRKLKSY